MIVFEGMTLMSTGLLDVVHDINAWFFNEVMFKRLQIVVEFRGESKKHGFEIPDLFLEGILLKTYYLESSKLDTCDIGKGSFPSQ